MFLSSSLRSFSLRDKEELSFPLCSKEGGSSSLSIASKETLLPSLQQERRSSSSLFAASKEELKGSPKFHISYTNRIPTSIGRANQPPTDRMSPSCASVREATIHRLMRHRPPHVRPHTK
ncbi:hypothetical protein ZIOFF_015514 [Zingiber officinale]|uniref:Uncharacterized protein n=1 Tax=Zingiber officinale TaxID=94328 RepID=A0A8J5HIW9_ZINOF|nr:hypothetical protein ZIOFF_015514 [Zingiber officinale]